MTRCTLTTRWLTGHVVLGALLGIVVLHPATSLVYWWFEPREDNLRHFITQRLVQAFAPAMVPMTGVFAVIGAGLGLAFGLSYHARAVGPPGTTFRQHALARALASLTRAGEGEELEFKASARWDSNQGKMNAELGDAVARTIAGFLNHRGGTLLVGVDDSGEIVGLERGTLRRQDRDGFEQFVMSLVTTRLGGDICPLIHVAFEETDGRDVCRIVVEPAPRPVYYQEGDGARFFLRAGNTTRALDVREAIRHIADRWPTAGGHDGHQRGATGCRHEASAMESHLEQGDTTRSEMLATIMPAHTRRLEALLDACVPRAADASSSADTLRAMVAASRDDLSHLRQLGASELGAFMPEHNARIRAFLNLLAPPAEEHS